MDNPELTNTDTTRKNFENVVQTEGIDAGRIIDKELAEDAAIKANAWIDGPILKDYSTQYLSDTAIQNVQEDGFKEYNFTPTEFMRKQAAAELEGQNNRAEAIMEADRKNQEKKDAVEKKAREYFPEFESLEPEEQNQLLLAITEKFEQEQRDKEEAKRQTEEAKARKAALKNRFYKAMDKIQWTTFSGIVPPSSEPAQNDETTTSPEFPEQ